MATKKRKKRSSSPRGAATSKPKRRTRRRRAKGLGGLPASGGSTGQKLLSGALLVGSGFLGGAVGAGLGNKINLPAGVVVALGSMAFAPEKYKYALTSAGVGMALAPGRLAVGTTPAAAQGVSGFDGFVSDATSRIKNFAGEIAEKAYVGAPVKKFLNIAGFGDIVDYSGKYNPGKTQYERMLAEAYSNGGQQMSGMDDGYLLAGLEDNSAINY